MKDIKYYIFIFMEYKYIKNISKGAFSICNLYKKKNNLYAIKKALDYSENLGVSNNELREIFALLILNKHPNIIRINEIYIDSGNAINIVYNYYSKTLFDFFVTTKNEERCKYLLQFINQMLSAIHYIHSNGIIHTDLKETNILVSIVNNKFEIKIIDFGSSTISRITDKYSIVSTYTIRAPEIYTYDKNYDNKIDLWSLGVLINKFITGKDILNPHIHNNSSDIEKIKYIYNFIDNLDTQNIEIKMKFFLKELLKIDPVKRLDVNNFILLFENIFKVQVPLYEVNNNLNELILSNKCFELNSLNTYISSRLFNIKLNNLYFGNLILEKIEDVNNLDYITIWYLNYQFTHSDVEYYLKDFLPIFNSYYKTIFDKNEINKNCFYLLDLIEFNLF
mgnify:CR=1 FL=1